MARPEETHWTDIISLDEVILESIPDNRDATAKVLRPIFDQIANAGGRVESDHFLPSGDWNLSLPNRA